MFVRASFPASIPSSLARQPTQAEPAAQEAAGLRGSLARIEAPTGTYPTARYAPAGGASRAFPRSLSIHGVWIDGPKPRAMSARAACTCGNRPVCLCAARAPHRPRSRLTRLPARGWRSDRFRTNHAGLQERHQGDGGEDRKNNPSICVVGKVSRWSVRACCRVRCPCRQVRAGLRGLPARDGGRAAVRESARAGPCASASPLARGGERLTPRSTGCSATS